MDFRRVTLVSILRAIQEITVTEPVLELCIHSYWHAILILINLMIVMTISVQRFLFYLWRIIFKCNLFFAVVFVVTGVCFSSHVI
jgi:hypothetical protein